MNPILKRIIQAPATLTSRQAGGVLGLSHDTVEKYVNRGKIGARVLPAARRDEETASKRTRHGISINRMALLRFLVRSLHGDEREELLLDIAKHAPKWLEMAQRAAEAASLKEQADAIASQPGKIVPIFGQPLHPRRRAAGKPDDSAESMPDLFPGMGAA